MVSPRIFGVMFAALLAGVTAFAQDALTSLAAVRALTPAKAAEHLPVQLEATVTYLDLHGENGLFIHDTQEGIYLKDIPDNANRLALKTGARLRIHARTHEGDFIPRLTCDSLELLSDGTFPKPVVVSDENLFSPELDCQWVKVTGTIIGTEPVVNDQFVFILQLYGWTVKLLLPVSDDLVRQAPQMMQRHVTFEGVAATVFNAQRQMTGRYFLISSPALIHPIGEVLQTNATILTGVDQLLRSDATTASWVRLRGVVTDATKNDLYLRGIGGSLRVHLAKDMSLKPGDQVEAEGFAAIAPFRPELRATAVKLLGKESAPLPVRLSVETKNLADLQAELIEVQAEYLGHRDNPEAMILQCRMDNRYFEAVMGRVVSLPKGLEPGAIVRLIGICELTTTHPLPRALWVDGFRLHLRSPDDLAIVSRPSWWTTGRLLNVMTLVGGLGLAAAAWAWTLRRRVVAQTEIISAQIEREAILSERRRLARDFHDTLEQELTGVAMQLDNAEVCIENTPVQARESLKLAKKMLHYSRDEARISISDLRSALLIEGGMAGAMSEILPPLAAGCAAKFDFQVTGSPWRMDVAVENQLLRMTREALANAVRHSGAAHIKVGLAYAPESVRLVVADDGRGFDPTVSPPRGHFGVIGLRERANRIGATLNIDSAPRAGTTVSVTLSAARAKFKQRE